MQRLATSLDAVGTAAAAAAAAATMHRRRRRRLSSGATDRRTPAYLAAVEAFNPRYSKVREVVDYGRDGRGHATLPHPAEVARDLVASWQARRRRRVAQPSPGREKSRVSVAVWEMPGTPDREHEELERVLAPPRGGRDGGAGAELGPVPLSDAHAAALLKECRVAIRRAKKRGGEAAAAEEVRKAREVYDGAARWLAQATKSPGVGSPGGLVRVDIVRRFYRSAAALLGCYATAGAVEPAFRLYNTLRRAGVADEPVFLSMLSCAAVAFAAAAPSARRPPLPELLRITFEALWAGVRLSVEFYSLLWQRALYHGDVGLFFKVAGSFEREHGSFAAAPPDFAAYAAWALAQADTGDGQSARHALELLRHPAVQKRLFGARPRTKGVAGPPAYRKAVSAAVCALARAGPSLQPEVEETVRAELALAGSVAAAVPLLAAVVEGLCLSVRAGDVEVDDDAILQWVERGWTLCCGAGQAAAANWVERVLEVVPSMELLQGTFGVVGDAAHTSSRLAALRAVDRYCEFGELVAAERVVRTAVAVEDLPSAYASILGGYALLEDSAGVEDTLRRLDVLNVGAMHRGIVSSVLHFVCTVPPLPCEEEARQSSFW
eukprot:Rhum_TRINITY_DN9752_c0_g1::Rhum_TRINITY_DN9752_c0_g1_i1::g.35014::m.35014